MYSVSKLPRYINHIVINDGTSMIQKERFTTCDGHVKKTQKYWKIIYNNIQRILETNVKLK